MKSYAKLFLFFIGICITLKTSMVYVNAQNNSSSDFVIENDILLRYNGTDTIVNIPEGVTAIGDSAFYNNKDVVSINLSDSVTHIGTLSFCGCSNLNTISNTSNIAVIESQAFFNCRNLYEIGTLANITSIGYESFQGTGWLQKKIQETDLVLVNHILIYGREAENTVIVPKEVIKIAPGAFAFAEKLVNVILPNSIIEIGDEAFYGCSKLLSVRMSDSVKILGASVFKYCYQLRNVRLSNALTVLNSLTFYDCKRLYNITIPESCTDIDSSAFMGCINLQYITLSEDLDENLCSEIGSIFHDVPNSSLYFVNGTQNERLSNLGYNTDREIKDVQLTNQELTLTVGDIFELRMNSRAKCIWKSSDSSIVSVNYYGKLRANQKGTATITAMIYGKSFTCEITVK